MDSRPQNCKFRLQEEGKSYARSGCRECGKTIMTGLGASCSYGEKEDLVDDYEDPEDILTTLKELRREAQEEIDKLLHKIQLLTEDKKSYTFQINFLKRIIREKDT